jgi:hypothetical protein
LPAYFVDAFELLFDLAAEGRRERRLADPQPRHHHPCPDEDCERLRCPFRPLVFGEVQVDARRIDHPERRLHDRDVTEDDKARDGDDDHSEKRSERAEGSFQYGTIR